MKAQKHPRLGVNIDHVATIRNARGGSHPDPIIAAQLAKKAGADGITAHLREDRRHISDSDIIRIKNEVNLPLNLEMAATDEMLAIALATKPNSACIVPEKRQELTTEGGLDIENMESRLTDIIASLKAKAIKVSLFIEPKIEAVIMAKKLGADIVELHTGRYCDLQGMARDEELKKIQIAAQKADELGVECHAGHGLNYDNVADIAKIANIMELNIGHFLIGEAVFIGLEQAVSKMIAVITDARNNM